MTANFIREQADITCEFKCDQKFRRNAAAVKLFKSADLIGLESGGIPEKSFHSGSFNIYRRSQVQCSGFCVLGSRLTFEPLNGYG